MTALPWGRILATLVVIAVGIALGGAVVQAHYEPQLAQANRKIGELEHAYLTLATATERQNAAVDALEAQGRARAEQARQDVQRAHGEAQQAYRAAQAILASAPAARDDVCRTASAEFAAELRRERDAQ